MSNMFDGLPVDRTEDTSSNNLSRKLNKLKRKQTQNYSEEREKNIKRLDELLNPPKTNNRKRKKKCKMEMDDDDYLEQAFRETKITGQILILIKMINQHLLKKENIIT